MQLLEKNLGIEQKLNSLANVVSLWRHGRAVEGARLESVYTIKGYRKDVLTKIHGGGARDRKRKLLGKQKKGKSKAKQFGKVEIPQEAFIGVLKINKET